MTTINALSDSRHRAKGHAGKEGEPQNMPFSWRLSVVGSGGLVAAAYTLPIPLVTADHAHTVVKGCQCVPPVCETAVERLGPTLAEARTTSQPSVGG